METTASIKNIRISPQKVKMVVDQIKRKKPQDAIVALSVARQKSAIFIQKLIKSALANAKNNQQLDQNTLKFKEIVVGKGVTFKRFRAGARGRAKPIIKRTTNLRIVLTNEVLPKSKPIKEMEAKNGTKS